MITNNPTWTYVLFGVALALTGSWAAGLISIEIVGGLLPILGFAGFNGLLTYIQENNWTVYVNTAVGVVGGLLFWFGVFTPEALAAWSTAWASVLGSALSYLKRQENIRLEAKFKSLGR